MKLQLGILNRDERSLGPADFQSVLGKYATVSSDTKGELVEGPLFISYCGDQITLEEIGETQPVKCGPYILTWDGRLDNRRELGSRLGIANICNVPDSVLVAKACARFGHTVLCELIGEFATVVWCQISQILFLARSRCGTRPLYYVFNKDRLIWSTDFAHLVVVSECDLTVNEEYVIEYLTSQPTSRHTPIKAIKAVPNGNVVQVERDWTISYRELWAPKISVLTYRSDRDHEEHFREKLSEAVRARLRARAPIFSELSGGLDSSSLVLTADQILKSDQLPGSSLKTLSCIYDESPTCDERYFIRMVEEARGTRTIEVRETQQRGTVGLDHVQFTGLPNPLHCFPGKLETYAEIMKEHGAHVLFTGSGGDHLFWSTADGMPIVADEMRRLNLVQMHRQCRTWSRLTAVPYFNLLLGHALPLVIRSLFASQSRYQSPPRPAWLRLKFRTTAGECNALLRSEKMPSLLCHLTQMNALFAELSAGYFNEYSSLYVSHPYAYGPLVEFCLSTHVSQFLRNGETKSLLRRALAGVLPSKLRQRKSKGAVEETFARAVDRDWSQIGDLRTWQTVERGYAEPGQLQRDFEHMRMGMQQSAFNLVRVCSIERWFRSLSLTRQAKPAAGSSTRAPEVQRAAG